MVEGHFCFPDSDPQIWGSGALPGCPASSLAELYFPSPCRALLGLLNEAKLKQSLLN